MRGVQNCGSVTPRSSRVPTPHAYGSNTMCSASNSSNSPLRIQQIEAEIAAGPTSVRRLQEIHAELRQMLAGSSMMAHTWNSSRMVDQSAVHMMHYLLAHIEQVMFAAPQKVQRIHNPNMAKVISNASSWYAENRPAKVVEPPEPKVIIQTAPAPEPETVYVVVPAPAPEPVVLAPKKMVSNDWARVDIDVWTPLHRAAAKGDTAEVKALLAAGALVNRANCDGWTPLNMTVWRGHQGTAEVLLGAGADVNRANSLNRAPMFWATSKGNRSMVKMLESWGGKLRDVASVYGEIVHR